MYAKLNSEAARMIRFAFLLSLGAFAAAAAVDAALPTIESLRLKDHLGYQSVLSDGFLTAQDGTQYDLSELVTYDDLLAPTRFIRFGNEAWEYRSGDVFDMPIYRGVFDGGETIVQAQREEDGTIVYAEIRSRVGIPDTYFVKTVDCRDGELLVFSADQLDEDASLLEEDDYFGDEEVPAGSRIRQQGGAGGPPVAANSNLPNFVYERGDGTSADCAFFKVVKIGIVYDSEFCSKFGGEAGARSRIMMIVAAASVFFENDMCVKLQLTDIYTPDPECSTPSTFTSFRRDNACGSGNSETFIRYFRDWMNGNRERLELDREATFHAFTGFPSRGTLGCAYIGTVCQFPDFAYGVGYMNSNSLSRQSIIFAHELGHNLNARHLTNEQAVGFNYVMNRSFNGASDGFSAVTINTILDFLDSDDVTCDTVALPPPTDSPTSGPTREPSALPSPAPSTHPSPAPSAFPTPQPSSIPSLQPSVTPSNVPTSSPAHCILEQVAYPPRCVIASSSSSSSNNDGDDDGRLFKCYDAVDLMSVIPGPACREKNPFAATVEFLSCMEDNDNVDNLSNDISNDSPGGGRRGLRKQGGSSKGKSGKRGGNNNEDNTHNSNTSDFEGDEVERSFDTSSKSSIAATGANNNVVAAAALENFESHTCNRGCILTGHHICFDSSNLKVYESRRDYVVSYMASHGDETSFHTVTVTIRRGITTANNNNNNNIMETCDTAETKCIDRTGL